ncbi:hypothetical protein ILUMI_05982 [Ignelater luminosus]|uniref:Uncharacterized protein n=1 Tax=Ignelater luminosus TaxID=2038154 RepID=A0A8K0DC00_IGNLU|nr:hypothetical protein ILUMI_05982 [Ignelater luminosus]
MAENVDCATYRENPELFKIKLRTVVEHITSDTSDCIDNKINEENLLEKQRQILETEVHKSVFNYIDSMWNQMNINPKISFLHELEKKYPENFVAWRPTCGEIPISSLKGAYLTETKERLLYKIQKFQEEKEELKKKHEVKLNTLKESFDKINKGEEYLLKLPAKRPSEDEPSIKVRMEELKVATPQTTYMVHRTENELCFLKSSQFVTAYGTKTKLSLAVKDRGMFCCSHGTIPT